MSEHISTTTVLPLCVSSSSTIRTNRLTRLPDRQPLGTCTLRRCPRLRDWFGHHIVGCTVCILWREDVSFVGYKPLLCRDTHANGCAHYYQWTIPFRQAYRERGELREGGLVGTGEQADVYGCEYTQLLHLALRRSPMFNASRWTRRRGEGGASLYVTHAHCRAASLVCPLSAPAAPLGIYRV